MGFRDPLCLFDGILQYAIKFFYQMVTDRICASKSFPVEAVAMDI